MSYFVITYDRLTGDLFGGPEEYPQSLRSEAMRRRFALEAEFRDRPEIEIVVIGADSLDDVKRSHGRYFYTVQELLSRAL